MKKLEQALTQAMRDAEAHRINAERRAERAEVERLRADMRYRNRKEGLSE